MQAGAVNIKLMADIMDLQAKMGMVPGIVGGAMRGVQTSVNSAKSALTGLLAGLTVAGFASWIKGAIDAADAASKLSAKTGVAVKDVAGLELAYKLAGVGQEGMSTSLAKLAKNMSDGNAGLRALGINTKESNGELRSTSSVLRDVADKFAGMEDGTAKTAMAMEIFGKTGAELIPLLNGGSAAMDEMDAMAKKLGLSMSSEAAANAEKFNDTMDLVAQGSQGVARGIAAELLPTLTNLAGSFLESMTEGDRLKNVAAFLASGLKILYSVGVGIVEVFSTVGKTIGAVAAMTMAALQGDFAGAMAIGKEAASDIGTGWSATAKQVSAAWNDQSNSAVTSAVTIMKSNKDLLADQKAREEAAKAAAAASKKAADEAAKMAEEGAKLAASLLAVESGLSGDFAKKWGDLSAAYKAGAINLDVLVKAQAALLAQQPAMKAAYDAAVKSSNEAAAARKAESDGITAWLRAQQQAAAQSLASVRDRVTGLHQEEQALALSRKLNISLAEAVEKLAIARLEEAQAAKFREGSEGWLLVQKEIDARKELVEAMSTKAVREKEESGWLEIWNSVDRTAHDTFVNVLQGGQDLWSKLKNTGKSIFFDWLYQMTLKKWIFSATMSVTGTASGVAQAAMGGGGAGGVLNTASTANSLYGGVSGYSSGVNAAAGFLGAGTTAGASALSLGYANAVGAVGGDALGALIAGNASWGGVAAGGAATAGAGAAGAGAATAGLAAVPVAGWIALAALAAYSVFAGKQDERFGSQGSYTPGKGTQSNGGPNGALDDFGAVSAGNKATATTIDKILERVGSKDRLSYFAGGFESSKNDNGFSYAGGILSNGRVFGQGTDGLGYMNLRGSMSPEEAQARYANELKQATLEALQSATDIPKAISSKLDGVNIEALSGDALNQLIAAVDKQIAEVDTFRGAMLSLPFEKLKGLSFDAAAGLIAASGGLEQLTANLGSYYENFFSAEEKRAVTVSNIASIINAAGANISASTVASATREQFRAYVEGIDVTTEAGQKLKAALLSVAGAFAGITEVAADTSAALLDAIKAARGDLDTALSAQSQQRISTYQSEASALQATMDKHRAYADELKKFRDSLLLSDLSPLTPEQRYAEAQQQFEAAKASGDAGQLQSASSALLEASKVYNASNATYISDFAKVQAALTQASINSSATADVAQLQLSAVQAQLDVLNVVNASVLSVADAIERLSAAVLAAVNAGQNPGLDNIAALTGGVQNQLVGNAYLSSGGAGAINGANGLQIYTPGGQHYTGDEVLKRAKELADAGDYRGMYDQAKAAGIGMASVNQLMGWSPGTAEEWAKANGLPTFASGGMHAGGLAMVGERGPELAYMPPARIYNAGDTARMLNGGQDNSELLAELRALREEVKQLRSQSSAQTGALIESNFAAHEKTAETLKTSTSKAGWSKKPELV